MLLSCSSVLFLPWSWPGEIHPGTQLCTFSAPAPAVRGAEAGAEPGLVPPSHHDGRPQGPTVLPTPLPVSLGHLTPPRSRCISHVPSLLTIHPCFPVQDKPLPLTRLSAWIVDTAVCTVRWSRLWAWCAHMLPAGRGLRCSF